MKPLPPYDQVPFAPGTSPFLIKGNNCKGSFIQYDELVPGGHQAVIASFQDERLRTYLSREFFTSSWYDIYPIAYADERAASLSGLPFEDFMKAACAIQARLDMN